MKRKDKNGLTRGKARYLFWQTLVGGDYLVKNKDGTCFIVDHGAGELKKRKGKWISDCGADWTEEALSEAEHDFDIVSWEDEMPLNILDYLTSNGWIRYVDGRIYFDDDEDCYA